MKDKFVAADTVKPSRQAVWVGTDTLGRRVGLRREAQLMMAVGGKHETLTTISTVTETGRISSMIVDGGFNHERLTAFRCAPAQKGRRDPRQPGAGAMQTGAGLGPYGLDHTPDQRPRS